VTQESFSAANKNSKALYQQMVASSYYGVLGIQPAASMREIRQAYRELSKQYHPDTTQLAAAIATAKFQELNEAYATLSNPERRSAYDRKIGYSNVPVVRSLPSLNQPKRPVASSSDYLEPIDRPLSPGEVFALFILGLTFAGCLILTITIGLTRSNAFQPPSLQPQITQTSQGVDPHAVAIPSPAIAKPDTSLPDDQRAPELLTSF
jgi:hypothetical protein